MLTRGTLLGHYRILEEVGRGGMGVVYRARDERLDRDVALKVLPAGLLADATSRSRFRREALTLSKLNHPHIATIHDFDEQGGWDFLVMEYVPGSTIAEMLTNGPFEEDTVVQLGEQIASGLAAAHRQNIVHRDIKPGNLKVDADRRVKILDLGLARQFGAPEQAETAAAPQAVTQPGEAIGTTAYMSPEQLRGQSVDPRSDVWALGVVLHEMVAGDRPFHGQTGFEMSSAILNEAPQPLPDRVSPSLRAVINRCLQKQPALRYQHATEVRAALEETRRTSPVTRLAPMGRAVRRVPRIAVLGLAAAAVAIAGLNAGRMRDAWFGPGVPAIRSLAVLPLDNLSGDSNQEYFADGMTEALIAELATINALKVISRTSVMQYKTRNQSMPEVARDLGVDGVVEGSVVREGDMVRITVRLLHGPTDGLLWVKSYERGVAGVLALQSEVAAAIAAEIRVAITPAEHARLASARPVNPAAYEIYVRGRHYWNQRTMRGYEQAAQTLRQALALDPGYAPAHAALADVYMLLGEQGGIAQAEAFALANAAIESALEADDSSAEAHASRAWWLFHYSWEWEPAERAFLRALELSPGNGEIRARYGRTLGYLGRFEQSIRELERARELDPLSVPVNAYLAQAHLFARQYDAAARQLELTSELNPNHPLTRHNMGELHLARGQFADALPELERAVELSAQQAGSSSSHYLAMLGCAYARSNRRAEALTIMEELRQRRHVSSFDLASLETALGNTAQALALLEEGYTQRDMWFAEIKAWPWLDDLRDEPRFQDLLRRLSFPE